MHFGDLRGNHRVAQITGPFYSSMGLACGPFPPHWLLLSVAGTKDMLLLFALLSSADLSALANSAVAGPRVCKDTNARNPLTVVGSVGIASNTVFGEKEHSGVF